MAKQPRVWDGSQWQELAVQVPNMSNYAYLPTTPVSGFRNAIINGDFRINQRSFSSTTTTDIYGFDRWQLVTASSAGSCTYSAQTFTVGNAISGYEPINYARLVTTGQSGNGTYSFLTQKIENVRTFAGQQVTVSFWARSGSATPSIAVELRQSFGTGGSPSSQVRTNILKQAINTTWTRYSITATVPSISGKTLGTNNDSSLWLNLWVSAGSDFNSETNTLGIQSNTFDFWGVQIEAGSVATPFEQRPIGTELALCQRYYQRFNGAGVAPGAVRNTTMAYCPISFPVEMRAAPTVTLSTAENSNLIMPADAGYTVTSVTVFGGTTRSIRADVSIGTASLTAGYAVFFQTGETGGLRFSAEL